MLERTFDLDDPIIRRSSIGSELNDECILQLRSILESLRPHQPRELEDAALMDGASPFQIFFQITLPLSKSILAIVAIFAFIGTWNSFLWPLLMMNTPEKQVLTVGLAAMQGRWNTRWPELMAGTLMSTAPIILLLVLFQNYVEEGLSFTGIKA